MIVSMLLRAEYSPGHLVKFEPSMFVAGNSMAHRDEYKVLQGLLRVRAEQG